jgi:hypothetical protein
VHAQQVQNLVLDVLLRLLLETLNLLELLSLQPSSRAKFRV